MSDFTSKPALSKAPDTPEDTKTKTKTEISSQYAMNFVIGVIVAIVVTVVIMMIYNSNYIQTISMPGIFLIFGLIFLASKIFQAFSGHKDNKYNLLFFGVLGVGLAAATYLINGDDSDTNEWGVYLLIAMHLIDLIYVILVKWSFKQPINDLALYGSIVADIGIVGVLLFTIF
jgi:hypothetical protein